MGSTGPTNPSYADFGARLDWTLQRHLAYCALRPVRIGRAPAKGWLAGALGALQNLDIVVLRDAKGV